MRYELYREGRYFIIPGFFRTLMYLKKQKKEFSVVFHTYGDTDDMTKAVHEFNKFCVGEHPCFNGRNNMPLVRMDGHKGGKDLRIRSKTQECTMYRFSGPSLEQLTMIQG